MREDLYLSDFGSDMTLLLLDVLEILPESGVDACADATRSWLGFFPVSFISRTMIWSRLSTNARHRAGFHESNGSSCALSFTAGLDPS
jgi:hypothetical protein